MPAQIPWSGHRKSLTREKSDSMLKYSQVKLGGDERNGNQHERNCSYTAARHLFHKSVLSVQSKSAHLLCYCTTNSALADNTETVLFPHNPCKSCTNSICAGFFDPLGYVPLGGNFWSLCTTTIPSYCSNRAYQNKTLPTMTMLSVTGRIFGYFWSNFQN